MIKEGYISQKRLEWINDNVTRNQNFPWYHYPISVIGFSKNWPSFTHTLIGRYDYDNLSEGEPNSEYEPFFTDLIKEICVENDIRLKRILRGGLNYTSYFKAKHSHTHYDHNWEHYNIIIYLNNFSKGSTYLFKETYEDEVSPYEAKKIIKEMKADVGKYVIFPGKNYHAAGSVGDDGEYRMICIYTIEIHDKLIKLGKKAK
tara:strand:- start:413 stop:1018 length:606 start_codon:yes stop_codon:yes gene_type:complete